MKEQSIKNYEKAEGDLFNHWKLCNKTHPQNEEARHWKLPMKEKVQSEGKKNIEKP